MSDSKISEKGVAKMDFAKAVWLGVGFVVFVLVLSVGRVFYRGYLTKEADVKTVAPRSRPSRQVVPPTASLGLRSEVAVVELGDLFEVSVVVDTQGGSISGVDAVVTFDDAVLEVVEVEDGQGFDQYLSEILNDEGRVYASAVASPGSPFQGGGNVAIITLKAKSLGRTTVGFDFASSSGGTKDSSVVDAETGEDVLAKVTEAVYTVVE